MTDALEAQFRRLGISRSRIHYEEFGFAR